MSWRVFRRARINQGVGVDMFGCSPVPRHLYTDEYSSVAISGLLDIDMNLMIPRLRLLQFLEETGRPRVGWIDGGWRKRRPCRLIRVHVCARAGGPRPLLSRSTSSPRAARAAADVSIAPLLARAARVASAHPPGSLALSGVGHRPHALRQCLARDNMHANWPPADSLSDSMQMFKWGVEGGRPAEGMDGGTRRAARMVLQG